MPRSKSSSQPQKPKPRKCFHCKHSDTWLLHQEIYYQFYLCGHCWRVELVHAWLDQERPDKALEKWLTYRMAEFPKSAKGQPLLAVPSFSDRAGGQTDA